MCVDLRNRHFEKRLNSAETLVPALSVGIRTAEEQNIALRAALRERDLRIDLLTRRLEVAAGERTVAKQEKSEAEQKVRDTETALLISDALVACSERRARHCNRQDP